MVPGAGGSPPPTVMAVNDLAHSEAVLATGGTVITASHRLARHIRWRHDQAQEISGRRAWPSPEVLPLDAWLRRTWESLTFRDEPLARRRLLSEDETRLVWRRVLAQDRHGGAGDDLDAGVIIPLVAAGWRLCQAWGIPASALRAGADSEDSRAFARWVDAYASELERRDWLDSDGFLSGLGQSGDAGRQERDGLLGFAGFEPWTPALRNLASSLRETGVTVVTIVPPRRAGVRQIVAAQDESDELARACRWAARQASTESGTAVGIVLANLEREGDRARRIALDILAPGWQLREPAIRPAALAAGRQLADYPIVFCALAVLRVLATEVTFEQASFLLRSCYLAGAEPERAGRARAELRLRREPLERVPLNAMLGVLGEEAPRSAAQWRAAEALVAPVRQRRLHPSAWVAHFSAWLGAAGWPGERGLGSEEYQAAEAWQRLLESFAGTDEVAGQLPLRVALGVLAQQGRDRSFEPESAGSAVQILSLGEAEGQDFSALWVCGVTADQWPPPARPHPLIPLALQQGANIPESSAATLEARTKLSFGQLLVAADQLVFSWPTVHEGTETLPSPLLTSLLLTAGETASAPGTAESSHPDRELIAKSATAEAVSSDPPPQWLAGEIVPGGSRVLALQAVCPARAFVEFRLRGAPLEAPARPLDLATRGKIVHQLLERLYGVEECRRGLGWVTTERLHALFAPVVGGVLNAFLPVRDPFLAGLRPVESERLWALVLSLRDLDMERSGFKVETEVRKEISIGALRLRIRLDRLDFLDDGGELVIDYKTGRFSVAGWKRPRLPDPQLPLYAVTAGSRGVAVIGLRPGRVKLQGVGDPALGIPGIKSAAAFFREADVDWSDTLRRWQLQLESLSGEFAAGDFRVDPADRLWAVGQFAGLTRIHEIPPTADESEATDGADE